MSGQPQRRYGVELAMQNRSSSPAVKCCRVPNCQQADLSSAPRYCVRHSICEVHIKALEVRSLSQTRGIWDCAQRCASIRGKGNRDLV
jgi:hypothetical protein